MMSLPLSEQKQRRNGLGAAVRGGWGKGMGGKEGGKVLGVVLDREHYVSGVFIILRPSEHGENEMAQ